MDGKASVALYAKDGKIWHTGQQIAELFGTSKQSICYNIINTLKGKGAGGKFSCQRLFDNCRQRQAIQYVFYSLEMILAIGYRVRGIRGIQFRQRAT